MTTRDTPEAVLAAALDKAGVPMPNVRGLHDPGGTPNRLRQARAVHGCDHGNSTLVAKEE